MRTLCLASQVPRAFRTQSTQCPYKQRRPIHSRNVPYNVGVIGGGITGLTTVFRLAQDPNCTHITLYEKSSRLGGWLQSETVEVDGGQTVFEYGPRTLRTAAPSCLPMLDLLLELDLQEQILLTPKTSPAARNRYIYFPDHLVRMPSPYPGAGPFKNILWNLKVILTEPVFEGFLQAIVGESWKEPRNDRLRTQDESVASFVTRRLSSQIADNLVSAIYHGIYAGDIERLSAQALLGPYRDFEGAEGRVLAPALSTINSGGRFYMMDDFLALHSVGHKRPRSHWNDLINLVKGCSILTLKSGMSVLTERLQRAVKASGKVEIFNTCPRAIVRDQQTSDLTVRFDDSTRTHHHIIATVPPSELADMIQPSPGGKRMVAHRTIKSLTEHNYAVSVMVVNLYYDRPDLIPVPGFGYLIPRSIPYHQNPERALGVIFGSESSIGQDTAPGTKITVMIGGHWWDGWKESDFPNHDTAVSMARSLLERHLGIKEAPRVAKSRLNRNAIPQYTVGHLSRMEDLSSFVREDFNRRLTLAGSWYNGVGVNDCIRQAYLSAAYGTGAYRLDDADKKRPWGKFNYQGWGMDGGIPACPQRWFLMRSSDYEDIKG